MKLSIITICLNDRLGLEETYESICHQTSQNFEWWVVDGRSNDGTVAWLEKHHHFTGGWISEPDNGIYDAMNKGIDLSTGDYLLFMNSGDRFAGPEVVERLLTEIKRAKFTPDFVYGDSLDIEKDGGSYYRRSRQPGHIRIGMPTRHQSMLYRRVSIADEQYPADFALSGDYALTASMLMKEKTKVLILNFPICHFSMSGRHDAYRFKALKEDFRIRKDILGENLATCIALFCIHWLHHHARRIFPKINRKIIYVPSQPK